MHLLLSYTRRFFMISALLLSPLAVAGEYTNRDDVAAFINRMVTTHHFDRAELTQWLDSAEKKQAILDAIAKPAEKEKTWKDYRAIFLTEERDRKRHV